MQESLTRLIVTVRRAADRRCGEKQKAPEGDTGVMSGKQRAGEERPERAVTISLVLPKHRIHAGKQQPHLSIETAFLHI